MNQETEFEFQARQERDSIEDKYLAACRMIAGLRKQIATQREYIEELEKQLEHVAPGLVKEVREFLGRE